MTKPSKPDVRSRTAVFIVASVALLCVSTARPQAQTAEPVQWTNLVNAVASGGTIQKSGGCGSCSDAGGTSAQIITSGDGYVEFRPGLGARLYAGLGSSASGNTDPALIDYAFSFWPDGGWDVRERNVYKTEGRFVAGDVFRVALAGGAVKYYKNGGLVHTSLAPPVLPLLLDTTLIGTGATVNDAMITAAAPPVVAPVTIGTAALPDAAFLQPYSAALQASGGSGSYRWIVTAGSLPSGLTLASTGAIAGAPSAAGVFTFTARATDASDAANFAERPLTIRVQSSPTPIAIQTATLASTRVGETYSSVVQATGGSGTYQWTIVGGTLPAGLALDATAGTIHGTPTRAGRFNVTVRAIDGIDGTNVDDRAFALDVLAAAPPSVYDAIVDRSPRAKGTLPALGGAGYTFNDPVFGTRLMRVTDGSLRPAALDRSYRTPSGTHSNAWSADGRYFYTVSTDGTVVPFSFDRETLRAERLQPSTTGDGGLTLRFFNEPTFSYITPGIAYGTYNGSGSNLRSVDQYDFQTGQYSQLVNLESLAPNLAGTYTGGLGASAGPVERVMAFFGGTGQDRHFYLVVFDKGNPSNRHLVDTVASTVDGQPANIALNFKIHAAAIDRSGRYVTIYPTGADLQAPRSAAPAYVWDTLTNTFTATPLVAARSGGHDAYGFGYRVNQDCCVQSTWDAAQWQLRSLATPLATFDLIAPVLLPKEVYLADHPSWHNAQPDRLVPFIDANYRYGANTTPWRAWDEEIIAVQTEGAGGGALVWRFAHHRSAVADDVDPSRISFWNTPRANVSPDGQWALFTSNWEKTLGTDPKGEAGGMHRQDVFLVELKQSSAALPVAIGTTSVPAGTVAQTYATTLQASGGSGTYVWSIASGAVPAGLALDASSGVIAGVPAAAGTSAFTVRAVDATDPANAADKALSITIAPAPLPPVVISTAAVPSGTASKAYSATLQATGGSGAYVWSVASGSLPAGLTLNTATGAISGTPSAAGTASFTVRAADAANAANADDQALSITIAPAPAPVVITTTTVPDAMRSVFYSTKLGSSGGVAPLKWSKASGSLPPGITLNATTGVLSGTPTSTGTWSFTVRVVDSAVPSTSDTQALSLRVRRRQ